MKIAVKKESDRVPAAVDFIRKQIDELNMKINECSLVEDVNGKLIYKPDSYSHEKDLFQEQKRKWEIMLDIIESKAPFSLLDW